MTKKKSSGGQYIVYTPEELAQARDTDMIEFLGRHNGYSFVREGSDYRCKEHNSLCIRSDRKRWYWNSQQLGGNNVLDWLQTVERFDFKTACSIVISKGSYDSRNYNPAPKTVSNKEKAVFSLPPAAEGQYKRAYSYLAYVRNISHEVITYCFQNKSLYQDNKYNCVFVGRDENGTAKFAERKSTSLYPYAIGKVDVSLSDNVSPIYMKALMRVGRSDYDYANITNDMEFIYDRETQDKFHNALKGHKFRGNISGCDFDYGFHIDAQTKSDKVFVFEAPIDVMAHCTLTNMKAQQAGMPDWNRAFLKHNRLSLSGTTDRSLKPYLDRHPEINQIIVCTDNDKAGRKAAENIKAKYSAMGYNVKYIPSKQGNDYAEYLDIIKEAQSDVFEHDKTYKFRR